MRNSPHKSKTCLHAPRSHTITNAFILLAYILGISLSPALIYFFNTYPGPVHWEHLVVKSFYQVYNDVLKHRNITADAFKTAFSFKYDAVGKVKFKTFFSRIIRLGGTGP